MIKRIPYYGASLLIIIWLVSLVLPAIDGTIGLAYFVVGGFFIFSTDVWAWIANPLLILLQVMIILRGRYLLSPLFWGLSILFSLLMLGAVWNTFNIIDYRDNGDDIRFASYQIGAVIWFLVIHLAVINTQAQLLVDVSRRWRISGRWYCPLLLIAPLLLMVCALISFGLLTGNIERSMRETDGGASIEYRLANQFHFPLFLEGRGIYQTIFLSRTSPTIKSLKEFNAILLLDLSMDDESHYIALKEMDSQLNELFSEEYWLKQNGIQVVIINSNPNPNPNFSEWNASYRIHLAIEDGNLYRRTSASTFLKELWFRPAFIGKRLILEVVDSEKEQIIYRTHWQLHLERDATGQQYSLNLDAYEDDPDTIITQLFD